MENNVALVNVILFLLLSIAINFIGVLCFGILFGELYFKTSIVDTNFFFYFHLVFYFLFNLALTYLLVVKKGVNKLFYVHIPISLFSIIPLMFFVGAFFR